MNLLRNMIAHSRQVPEALLLLSRASAHCDFFSVAAESLEEFILLNEQSLPVDEMNELRSFQSIYIERARRGSSSIERPPFTVIPVDISKGLPVVECEVHEKPARLLLDTGAEMTLLDPVFGESAGIGRLDTIRFKLQGSIGDDLVSAGFVEEMTMKTLRLRNHPCLFLDLTFLPNELDVQGILGVQSVFGRMSLAVDLFLGQIEVTETFAHPCAGAGLSGWRPLWRLLGRDLVFTSTQLRKAEHQNTAEALFYLDTGGHRSSVTERLVSKAGLRVGSPEERKVFTPSDQKRVIRPRIKRVDLWVGKIPLTLHDVDVVDPPKDWIAIDGKFGMDILDGKRLLLDYPQARWCFMGRR